MNRSGVRPRRHRRTPFLNLAVVLVTWRAGVRSSCWHDITLPWCSKRTHLRSRPATGVYRSFCFKLNRVLEWFVQLKCCGNMHVLLSQFYYGCTMSGLKTCWNHLSVTFRYTFNEETCSAVAIAVNLCSNLSSFLFLFRYKREWWKWYPYRKPDRWVCVNSRRCESDLDEGIML